MMDFVKIIHTDTPKRPLRVSFLAGGREYQIDVRAVALQSFRRFQAAVADRLGVWLADPTYGPPRLRREDWEDMVAEAFATGRSKLQEDSAA